MAMELWRLKFTSAKNMENPTSPTAVEQLQKIASEFYHTFLEDKNHDDNSAALAVVEVVTKIAQLPVRSACPVKFCRESLKLCTLTETSRRVTTAVMLITFHRIQCTPSTCFEGPVYSAAYAEA